MPTWIGGLETGVGTAPALGYVSRPAGELEGWPAARDQATQIERACMAQGLELGDVIRDAQPVNGTGTRPALRNALEQVAAREAGALVVARLECLAGSASGVGAVVAWFDESDARLIAVDVSLDTASPGGRIAARALVAAGELERSKLGERTRRGLAAARRKGGGVGRPSVADDPELRERVRSMRTDGLTLQAIADQLNADGIPTLRGGAEWRPSSVQAAAGYKRPGTRRSAREVPRLSTETRLSSRLQNS